MSITPDDVRAYMAAKWTSIECLRCGGAGWSCGEVDNLNGLLPIGSSANTMVAQTRETLPIAWIVCNDCGHVEMIAIKAIEHWRAGGGHDSE